MVCNADTLVAQLAQGQRVNGLSRLHFCGVSRKPNWWLDPDEETVLLVLPEQRVQLLKGAQALPVLAGLPLELTVEQVLGWLTL